MSKLYFVLILLYVWSCNVVQSEDKLPNTFDIESKKGIPLLTDVEVAIHFTDGQIVSSKDDRFSIQSGLKSDVYYYDFIDERKEIDFHFTYQRLDELSLRTELQVVNQSQSSLYIDKIVSVQGKVKSEHNTNSKVLVTSKNWQDDQIIFVLSDTLSTVSSMYTVAIEEPSLAAGFLAGKKHFNHIVIQDTLDNLYFQAYGEGNGCELKPGATRFADPLFISFQPNSLQQLEKFAQLAAQENDVKLWPTNRAVWCTWYAGWNRDSMYTYKEGIAEGIQQSIPVIRTNFLNRGANTIRICDDHIAYGDWYDTTRAFPEGFAQTATKITDAGLTPGVWYPTYWASTESNIYQEKPEWFAMKEDGSVYFLEDEFQNRSRLKEPHKFVIFDTSLPEVQDYFEKIARTWKERGFEYVTNDFLAFATAPPRYHDPTLSKAEVLRKGMEAVRRGLGEDVFYRTIGSEFGTSMGISNDMRISGDSHGDRPFAYHRTGSLWYYNHRLWINDPSAIVFRRYGEERDVEWNKMWISWIALAGTVMTYGEALDELPAEFINIYKKMFPPLYRAGKPLDLWENQPYMLWGMPVEDAEGDYQLFGIFELEGKEKSMLEVNLDEVSARTKGWEKPASAPESYLLWDFWNEKLTEVKGNSFEIQSPNKSCYLFALREKKNRPQLLGTNGHFSMGVIETSDMSWNESTHEYSGMAKGNGGDPTTLFIYVPDSYKVSDVSINNRQIPTETKGQVLKLHIPQTQEMVKFKITFSGSTKPFNSRTFVQGSPIKTNSNSK